MRRAISEEAVAIKKLDGSYMIHVIPVELDRDGAPLLEKTLESEVNKIEFVTYTKGMRLIYKEVGL